MRSYTCIPLVETFKNHTHTLFSISLYSGDPKYGGMTLQPAVFNSCTGRNSANSGAPIVHDITSSSVSRLYISLHALLWIFMAMNKLCKKSTCNIPHHRCKYKKDRFNNSTANSRLSVHGLSGLRVIRATSRFILFLQAYQNFEYM